MRVIWLKPLHGRAGMEVERVECELVCMDGAWATVELATGERCAVPTRKLIAVVASAGEMQAPSTLKPVSS